MTGQTISCLHDYLADTIVTIVADYLFAYPDYPHMWSMIHCVRGMEIPCAQGWMYIAKHMHRMGVHVSDACLVNAAIGDHIDIVRMLLALEWMTHPGKLSVFHFSWCSILRLMHARERDISPEIIHMVLRQIRADDRADIADIWLSDPRYA